MDDILLVNHDHGLDDLMPPSDEQMGRDDVFLVANDVVHHIAVTVVLEVQMILTVTVLVRNPAGDARMRTNTFVGVDLVANGDVGILRVYRGSTFFSGDSIVDEEHFTQCAFVKAVTDRWIDSGEWIKGKLWETAIRFTNGGGVVLRHGQQDERCGCGKDIVRVSE